MRKVSAVLVVATLFACQSSQPANSTDSAAAKLTTPTATAGGEVPIASKESAVAPEVNPPGDIPDTQAFVSYRSSAGNYSFDVPEGWARTESGSSVTFISKLDGVKAKVSPASAVPTAASARANEAAQIESQGHAVSIISVSDVALPNGKAVVVTYDSNSEPNPVTQKRVRLENEAYLYFRNGKLATVTFWAPKGADNADQWNRMSKSFRWQ
jgi:hypothetical protein